MFNKVYKLIHDKSIVVPSILFTNYRKLNITELELIILIYFINNTKIYNPKEISEVLNISLDEVLITVNSLQDKLLITIDMEKRGDKKVEVANLKQLYEKLTFLIVDEEEEVTTIYDVFEQEFARSLSPLEYDLINAWIDAGYSEEIIKEALKEAIYNNVTSLKYIDKILEEWRKKGVKNKQDIINVNKAFKEHKKIVKDDFDYDWLNEE